MKAGRIRMTREQLLRTGHLMHMRYTPVELAKEIGCDVDAVPHSYIPAGCPHERDAKGQLWIVGTAFRDWARTTFMRKNRRRLTGQAYCLKCRRMVDILSPREKRVGHRSARLEGQCSRCGQAVSCAVSRSQHGQS